MKSEPWCVRLLPESITILAFYFICFSVVNLFENLMIDYCLYSSNSFGASKCLIFLFWCIGRLSKLFFNNFNYFFSNIVWTAFDSQQSEPRFLLIFNLIKFPAAQISIFKNMIKISDIYVPMFLAWLTILIGIIPPFLLQRKFHPEYRCWRYNSKWFNLTFKTNSVSVKIHKWKHLI